MYSTKAYAAQSATAPLAPFSFDRRDPAPDDVQIDIEFCGVCHSDLHTARSEWGPAKYPCVPGHEIVGRVAKVGSDVENFREGDLVAVGCMVDSCGECENCREDLEQFCERGATFTYNSEDKHTGGHTFGGYSKSIVVDQDFVLRVPKNLDLAGA
ncbi:MAG: alcohol dehydrogenase catalytic domain-containing protein, partial [Verrucomicrobiota bacterium]|nr:alcohol dehydrogenase catalytic domain-containing protein [Verrucomicrobiota bacterium]